MWGIKRLELEVEGCSSKSMPHFVGIIIVFVEVVLLSVGGDDKCCNASGEEEEQEEDEDEEKDLGERDSREFPVVCALAGGGGEEEDCERVVRKP